MRTCNGDTGTEANADDDDVMLTGGSGGADGPFARLHPMSGNQMERGTTDSGARKSVIGELMSDSSDSSGNEGTGAADGTNTTAYGTASALQAVDALATASAPSAPRRPATTTNAATTNTTTDNTNTSNTASAGTTGTALVPRTHPLGGSSDRDSSDSDAPPTRAVASFKRRRNNHIQSDCSDASPIKQTPQPQPQKQRKTYSSVPPQANRALAKQPRPVTGTSGTAAKEVELPARGQNFLACFHCLWCRGQCVWAGYSCRVNVVHTIQASYDPNG